MDYSVRKGNDLENGMTMLENGMVMLENRGQYW